MTQQEVASLGTILGVWAHPDDETYLSGGLMAAAVKTGGRVVCVTATRGEEGSPDHERWPPSEIGRIREAELMSALGILGVTEHIWLDYRDGACAAVPVDEGIAKVREIIEREQPDSVLTFGPDGMTGHPDHVAVSMWTTEAFHIAAKPGAHLYFATTTPAWAERFVPAMQDYNVFGPGTPPVTPVDELAINFRSEGELGDLKLRAISAQVSQVEGLLVALGEDLYGQALIEEAFRLSD